MEPIHTARLTLREFTTHDLPALHAFNGDSAMHVYENEVPAQEDTRILLERSLRQANAKPRIRYDLAVTTRVSPLPIGRIKFAANNYLLREWEIGWGIAEPYWGNGFAVEAAQAMIDYAFTTLKLHRIIAFCNANNHASIRVMQKLGMTCDGCLRQALWWRDGWCDEMIWSLLESERGASGDA